MGVIKDTVACGIVRRVDDLGRLVIPKEVRALVGIHEGDPMSITVTDDGRIILDKCKGGLEREILALRRSLNDINNYDALEEDDVERLRKVLEGLSGELTNQFDMKLGKCE